MWLFDLRRRAACSHGPTHGTCAVRASASGVPHASPTVASQVLAAQTKAERALWIAALQAAARGAAGSGPSPAATADEAARRADGARLSETAALGEGDAAAQALGA